MKDLVERLNANEENIMKGLETLVPKTKKIIELHYGLNGNERLALTEIADVMKMSVEKVRQFEAKGLRNLEQTLPKRKLIEKIKDIFSK